MEANTPPDLGIVIVSWNVRALVTDALRSLLDDLTNSGLRWRVIVVDSASTDGTAAHVQREFSQADVIALEENRGFGAANNIGLRALGFGQSRPAESLPRAVLLLNPDTIVQPGAVRALYDALFDLPKTGLVGARLTFGDGSFQHSAFTFPGLRQLWVEFFPVPGRLIESPFNGRYPRSDYENGRPFPVDFVLGASMMLRAEVIEQTGMFDERFVMYCEEIDWAWRIRRADWQVYCVPAAHITHLGGQSTSQVRPQSVIHLWTSRMRLYQQYHPRWKAALARWMIRCGMALKLRHAKANSGSDSGLISAYNTVRQLAAAPLPESM